MKKRIIIDMKNDNSDELEGVSNTYAFDGLEITFVDSYLEGITGTVTVTYDQARFDELDFQEEV